ncbi:TetR/AcrR family transcriptional regulator [Streptomyces sp. WAC07061]|uniref:TetR/AcrR family transcriptional regulator n=1 Tax=Streptomyces sp. WAC07061 TaxID=2487410 RepID=UPI000F771F4F|nr:TetR/AcrR family transcriptional regulator [Streptomyces sp. WAC07061]RSS43750.1 TetR/AcrR family transcriptional regulator [Streptomyces sp. WAC07061]
MTNGQGHAPAGPPRRTDARRNRERLVAAAREVFAEAGPGASLNEIARRAGVGAGTLYRHFPHRSALLTAVLADRIGTLCAYAQDLLASEGADDALERWLRAFLTHARVHHGMGSALLLEPARELGFDCHQRILDAATGLLARAQRHGTARADVTADDLLQLVVGIALSTAHGGRAGQAEGAEGAEETRQPEPLLDLVLDAVHGAPRGPAG